VAATPVQLVGLMLEVMVKLELHYELVNFPMIKNQCGYLVDVELLLDLVLKMN
jgi:hypothetical protein